MSLSIPQELIEQLKKGNVVLFCGAGISVSEGGLPSGGQLARELAERAGRPEMANAPLPEVAQAYELEMGHHDLIEYIVGRIDDPRYTPLRTHQLITALPFTKIVTTNWDNLLEEALRLARKPFIKVVDDPEVAYADEAKVLLIKLHGSIEQKDSIIITGDDYYDVFARLPETANLVQTYFATKTVLFLGFGLADEDFKRLYHGVVRRIGVHKRRAYAVQLDPDKLTIKYWESKNVKIIGADAAAFLEALADALGKDIVPPSEPTPSVARQPRRVDAALPSQAQVGQSIDLVIAVKLPESPRLDAREIRDTGISRRFLDDAKAESKPVEVEFPLDERTGRPSSATLDIRVIAPNFEIHGPKRKSLLVPFDRDSELCTFPMSPRKPGELEVSVELYSQRVLVGTMRLETVVRSDSGPIDGKVPIPWMVVTLPLAWVIAPSGGMTLTALQPSSTKIEQHAGDHAIQIGQVSDTAVKRTAQESIEVEMAKKTSRQMTFLERVWVPIIVALIAAVAAITVAILNNYNPVTTPSPSADFAYLVRVQVKDTDEVIPNAEVTIEVVGKAPLDDMTDSNGLGRIFIDSSYAGQPGVLIVRATGYMTYRKNIDLKKDKLPNVVMLAPAP